MKSKVFSIFLISIISMFSLGTLKVCARTFCVDEVKYDIASQVVNTYKKYTDAEVSTNVIAVPFQKLVLPDGKVEFVVTSTYDKFMQRDLKKVVVNVDGKMVKTFNVPVEVKAYKNVLVATTMIDREKILTSNVVTTKKMEVSGNLDYVLTDNMLNKDIITKKVFRDGEVIDKRFVRLRPDVTRNNAATAYFSGDNLTVSIDVIPLSDGMIGDYVGVENKAYGKVYTGKVIGENKVLIQL